jgi:hypothetical protein
MLLPTTTPQRRQGADVASTGLPWFKLFRDLPNSAKLLELEATLGPAALAYLVKLWCHVAAHRPDGDLRGVSPAVLARWADWRGVPAEFVDALRGTGWLTEDNQVHAWADRQAGVVAKVARDRRLAAESRVKVAGETGDDIATVATKSRDRRKIVVRPSQQDVATNQNSVEAHDNRNIVARPSQHSRATVATQSCDRGEEKERREEESEIPPTPLAGGALPVSVKPQNRPPLSFAEREALVRRERSTPRALTLIGIEEQERKPRTPAALVLALGDELAEAWPQDLSPNLQRKVEGLYADWSRHYDERGEQVARARLLGWLEKDRDEQRKRMARNEPQRLDVDATLAPYRDLKGPLKAEGEA